LWASAEDVENEGGHDGDSCPHGVLPAVDERLLGDTDQNLRMGAGLVRGGDGVGDAFARGIGRARGNAGESGVDGVAVAGGQERSEQGNAERGAEFAGDAVGVQRLRGR